MNNLKNIEQLMKLSARRTNTDYYVAFENMATVYRFFDSKDHSNHCQIINFLYNTDKKKKFTYVAIAQKFNTSDNALRRYRKEYAAMFYFFLSEEHEKHKYNTINNNVDFLKAL